MSVRLVHEGTVVADSVDVAETLREKFQGVMFRDELPEGYALVFPFESVKRRSVHMLFVRVPIDVIWVTEEVVTKVRTLSPWTGFGWGEGDMIIEMGAGSAAQMQKDDSIRVEDSLSSD